MDIYSLYKQLNPNTYKCKTTLQLDDVKDVLAQKLDWSFLTQCVQDIIRRYSFSLVEVFDVLYRYKFLDNRNILDIISDISGLSFVILDELPPLSKHSDGYIIHDINATEYDVYINAGDPTSEAHLTVELPGELRNVHYILPSNFKTLCAEEQFRWDSYILFNRYMLFCVENKSSDIHFDVVHTNKEAKYRAMCRIGPDRVLCDLFNIDSDMNSLLVKETIIGRSSNQSAILDLDNGSGVTVNIPDVFGDGSLEVRFTANRVRGGYYCVCRLQETKTSCLPLEQLGFDAQIVKSIREMTARPSGLTVITGKIRTGKNTTMSAICGDINNRAENFSLLGLDNPIEILGTYPQVDYKGDIKLLTSTIKMSKKLDLDYISINEIPDSSVAFGVRDLVNSSIHTITTWHMNRVWHLPHKLFEYFGESYRDLLSQMNMVCNQRLYKRQCPHCLQEVHRTAYGFDDRLFSFFSKYNLTAAKVATGCTKCNFTKQTHSEIVVLPELLTFDEDLVTKLFSVQHPYEMECILRDVMRDSPFSLEHQMKQALEDGRLAPSDILSII